MSKKWLLTIPVVMIAIYLAGPAPASANYSTVLPTVPTDAKGLEDYIKITKRNTN